MIEIALYQPEIPQNTGTLLRLGACMDVKVHVIKPTGYVFSDRRMKRSGMDYLDLANLVEHDDFNAFLSAMSSQNKRLIYLTPHATETFTEFKYSDQDVLIMGKESTGIPDDVASHIPNHLTIPMNPKARSINVAIACAMVTTEALRQLGGFNR